MTLNSKSLAILTLFSLLLTACDSTTQEVKNALEKKLIPLGAKEVIIDSFIQSPNNPNLAYTAATVVHNFASRDGKIQKEHSGYLLEKGSDGWAIRKLVQYTKDRDAALRILAGEKI